LMACFMSFIFSDFGGLLEETAWTAAFESTKMTLF
jgi:hypothetical protein